MERRDGDACRCAPLSGISRRLAPPTEGQDLVADFASLDLTLGRHPLASTPRKTLTHAPVDRGGTPPLPARPARARRHLIGRQRPDTASASCTVHAEDQTGAASGEDM